MRRIRTYSQVADPATEDIVAQVAAQHDRLARRMARVRRVIVVGSGKGGVGKSALTANLAAALAARGRAVGAVDADLNGPSLARMLATEGQTLVTSGDGVRPATGVAGVRVMSMDLLLPAADAPLRWRVNGALPPDPATRPRTISPAEFIVQSTFETGTLREFLADVAWGALDDLLIDAPPGTDRLIRLIELLPRLDALLLVTTPSEMSRYVVAKSVRLARDAGVPRAGLAANMTAHVCEACGHTSPLFEGDGAAALAADSGIELWGDIPFDSRLAVHTDRGDPFVLAAPTAPAARAIRALADRLDRELGVVQEPLAEGAGA